MHAQVKFLLTQMNNISANIIKKLLVVRNNQQCFFPLL